LAEPVPASNSPASPALESDAAAAALIPGEARFALGVALAADFSKFRETAMGVQLSGSARFDRENWIGANLSFARSGSFFLQNSLTDANATTLWLAWGQEARVGQSAFHIRLEVGPQVSWLLVVPRFAGARPIDEIGFSLAASGELAAEISTNVRLGVRGLLAYNVLQPAFHDSSGTLITSVPPAGLGGQLTVSQLFW
jgi:hypothetical protein